MTVAFESLTCVLCFAQSSAFWRIVSGFLSPPSAEQKQCHHPKLILLNTGKVSLPYKWDPDSVPISVMRVGRLFILSVPCEFTTMAGRRLRKAIREIATQHGIDEPEVTIAGLANSYTHYVTTFEEYQGQRYEAASTLYGPHTLSTYIQEFKRITGDMLSGNPSSSDGAPNDLSHKQISLIPPVVVDTIAVGHKVRSHFGARLACTPISHLIFWHFGTTSLDRWRSTPRTFILKAKTRLWYHFDQPIRGITKKLRILF